MNNKRIPLAIALAAALCGTPPGATAAALGEIAALSALGDSFRAEIMLPGGTAADAECFRVVPASAGDIPTLRRGRVTVSATGAGTRLVVRDTERINEPVLRLALENVCESRLRREYTLLMPFAQAARLQAAPASASAPASAKTPAAPAARSRPAAARAATPARAGARTQAARPGARALNMTGDESLTSLAESLYPDDDAARARFTKAAAAANPELFPDATAHTRILPAGTALRVPDLRTRHDPAVPPGTTPAPVASATSGPSPDRLMVDKGNPARATAAGSADTDPRSAHAKGLAERERALATAIDRSIITEMELLARIKELEEIQAGLQARIRAATAATTTPPAAAVAAVAPRPAPPPAPSAEASAAAPVAPPLRPIASARTPDAYLFGGLGLAALLLVALLRRARGRDEGTRALTTPPTTMATTTATLLEGESPKGRARAEENGFSSGATMGKPDARPGWPASTESSPVEEHKSAVELADIMMSFGRVNGAADTLAEFIRGNPREAVTPWLKLLEVYRAAGMHAEFDAIAGELNKTFNVTRVSWDNYDALRASRMSLEDLPHIAEALQKGWRTAACQRYLRQLLRDNRNGTRAGFPFAVIDEILTLSAILEEELGPCPPPAASTS
jgi:Tfp pilus assembly protein FimV